LGEGDSNYNQNLPPPLSRYQLVGLNFPLVDKHSFATALT
jgi:hypothetical protein